MQSNIESGNVSKKKLSDGMGRRDNNLWGAITLSDTVNDSNLYFEVNNNSKADISLVGCDSEDGVTPHLSDFNGVYPKASANAFWANNGYSSNGVAYDMPSSDINDLQENYIHFNSWKNGVVCYYRVFTQKSMEPMYLKLVNDNEVFQTMSSLAQQLTYPAIDANKYKDQTIHMLQLAGGAFGAAGTSLLLQYRYNIINSRNALMQAVTDFKPNSYLNNFKQLFDEYVALVRFANVNITGRAFSNKLKAIKKELKNKYYLDDKFTVRNILEYQPRSVIENGEIHIYDIDNIDITNNVLDEIKLENDINSLKSIMIKNPNIINPSQLLNAILTDTTLSVGEREVAENGVDEIMEFGTFKVVEGFSDATSLGLSGVVGFIAFQVATDFVTKWATPDSSVQGSERTGRVVTHFEVPTSADVAAWNNAHTESSMQIDANTIVTHAESNGPNIHIDKFALTDNPAHNISIFSKVLTSPFIRPYNNDTDPYLGDLRNGGVDHKHDAVIQVNISDNSVDFEKNDINDAQNAVYTSLGYGDAVPVLHPAPQWSVSSIQDRHTGKVVYSAKSNPHNTLYASNGLKRVGDIEGLFVMSGESVVINTTLLSDPNHPDYQYGGGMDVSYVVADDDNVSESGIDPWIDQIDSSDEESMLSKYNTDNPESSIKYLFAKANQTSMSPKVGDNIPLTLVLDGMSGSKSEGHLYLADQNSKTVSIPVYLNYHLVTEPKAYTVSMGDSDIYPLTLLNNGNRYESISVSGLPDGTKIVNNSCSNGLDQDKQCEIDFDFSGVDMGSSDIIITGDDGSKLSNGLSSSTEDSNRSVLRVDIDM